MSVTHEAESLTTPRELAKKYGVAVSTFMSWHHAGIFGAEVSIGKVYRFREVEVAAGLKRHAKKRTKTAAPTSLA